MKPLISVDKENKVSSFDILTPNEKNIRKKSSVNNILTNQKITGRNSEKDIRHIEII